MTVLEDEHLKSPKIYSKKGMVKRIIWKEDENG